MLQNIKIILGINDNLKDQLILLYIGKITNVVLEYCGLDGLNATLESFVEDKVVAIMKSKNTNDNTVKAITRGDTKIEYNVAVATSDDNTILNSLDKDFLNRFRKVRFI